MTAKRKQKNLNNPLEVSLVETSGAAVTKGEWLRARERAERVQVVQLSPRKFGSDVS